MSKTILFKVSGDHKMDCAGCESSVTFTLSRLPEVERVTANWRDQSIRIDLAKEDADLEVIKRELDTIGYQVTST